MPIYEYEHVKGHGPKCEGLFEEMQAMSAAAFTVCPVCGKPVQRVVSRSIGKMNKFEIEP